MSTTPMITMPEDLDETFNQTAFRAGMPYTCWGCAKEWMPGDSNHPCLNEFGKEEEILAAPYASKKTNLLYRLAMRNASIDRERMVRSLVEKHPLLAVSMSLLVKTNAEDRPGWIEQVEGLDDRIKQRLLAIKV